MCQANQSWAPTPRCLRDCGILHVEYGGTITGNTTIGASHAVTCYGGYAADQAYTVCRADGTWSPAPVCLRDCGTYPIEDGETISGQTTEGTNVSYSCTNGFVEADPYTVCQYDRTWNPTPKCIRDCESYVITNGDTISGNTTEGATHHFNCSVGYIPSANLTVCQSDGTWLPTPFCDFGGCPSVNVTNGTSIMGTTELVANTTVVCDVGFLPESPWTVCLDNGTWSPTPVCIIDCGRYAIEDGATISGRTTVGTNVSYSCTNGFVEADPYTVCQYDRTWKPSPKCIRDCGDYVITNGDTISGNTTEGATHHFNCSVGYLPSADQTVCQTDGTWLPTPACEFGGCPSVSVAHGTFITGTTKLAASLTVECDIGYLPENNLTVCVDNGTWSPPPACSVDTSQVCLCIPRTYSNLTLEEQAQYYVDVLTMRKEELSKTRRQLTSAEDDRTSAQFIGITGALILTSVWATVFVPDVINVFAVLYN